MVFGDFREYLTHLERHGKLAHVTREVEPRFGIAAGIRKVSDTNGPALLYENIRGHPGWRVAAALYATQKRMALALRLPEDATEDQIMHQYRKCRAERVPPVRVSTGPVKEIIIRGEDVDLGTLPVPTYSEKDAGPYLTAGVEIARDPESGRMAASIHRRKVLGKDTTSLLALPHQRLGRFVQRAEKKGQGLPIATVLGADPALTLATQVKLPLTTDKDPLAMAGAFRGAPLEMVPCETIDLEVPANAEIVIEGQIVPGDRVPDGPFGEWPGNYLTFSWVLVQSQPRVKVTAITMRRDAIFPAVLTGVPMTEGHWLHKWAFAAAAYDAASNAAEVVAVNFTVGGAGTAHMVVSIRKTSEREPLNLIRTLLSGRFGLAKLVIVVDDDIDVYNASQVEWALATRVWPQRDIFIFPPTYRGEGASPSTVACRGQWGIDATMPLGEREMLKRVVVPGVEVVDYV